MSNNPILMSGEALSPAEQSYMSSGGSNTEGLFDGAPAPSEPAPAPEPVQEPAPAPAAEPSTPADAIAADPAPSGQEEPEELGEIVVEPDGKLRNARTGKFVPHQALHQERMQHKETRYRAEKLEQELATQREQFARAQERLALLNEALTRTQQQPAAQPQQQAAPTQEEPNPFEEATVDPEVDVFAWAKQKERRESYLRRENEALVALLQARDERFNKFEQKSQARDTETQMRQTYQADALRFMVQQNDFADAYKHLIEGRRAELEYMGIADKAQQDAAIAQEEREIVASAIQSGKSPAAFIYGLSQRRGYRKAEPAPAPTPAPVQPQQPVQPAPKPIAANPAQRIETAAKAQAAAATLSGAGGGSTPPLTMQSLVDMSEAEFAKLTNGFGGVRGLDAKMRQMMGA